MLSPGDSQYRLLQVIAHPDDDILFNCLDLLNWSRAGGCLLTVVLTGGEVSRDPVERRKGLFSAHLNLGCCDDVAPEVEVLQIGSNAAEVVRLRSHARPEHAHTFCFMSLPDDRLEQFRLDRPTPAKGVAGVSPTDQWWTWHSAVAFIREVIRRWDPAVVWSMDPTPDPRLRPPRGDHPDHTTAAVLTFEAAVGSGVRVVPFRAYNVQDSPENATMPMQSRQAGVSREYAYFDPEFVTQPRWFTACRRTRFAEQGVVTDTRVDRATMVVCMLDEDTPSWWWTEVVGGGSLDRGPQFEQRLFDTWALSLSGHTGDASEGSPFEPVRGHGHTLVAHPVVLGSGDRRCALLPTEHGVYLQTLSRPGTAAVLVVEEARLEAVSACLSPDAETIYFACVTLTGEVRLYSWDVVRSTCREWGVGTPAAAGPIALCATHDSLYTAVTLSPDGARPLGECVVLRQRLCSDDVRPWRFVATHFLRGLTLTPYGDDLVLAGFGEDGHFVVHRVTPAGVEQLFCVAALDAEVLVTGTGVLALWTDLTSTPAWACLRV